MSEQKHHVVFKGKIVESVTIDIVKPKLAALFKINIAQVDAMMSGKAILIKKNVDLTTAKKYQAAMHKAGAVTSIIPANTTNSSATATPQATPTNNKVILPGNSATSVIPDTQAPQTVVHVQSNANTDSLSMAEAGADLHQHKTEQVTPDLDISNLSMSAQGQNIINETSEAATLDIDTSALSLK